ncbi:TrmH family RNA methyltransferase [Propionivibrio dicarboxylicus]|uniref:RNA methyltransferase, TrmH family n=1 Tax=Propionivibrio dicarboxylicus TaxID=83767 RepID=A0A1G8D8Z8_9RHOO|nr:RNA methyltransferase [Propionivibrio dicarboxylicus]SDH54258.1 RNA methyltransferase, TrmH family [Propionivibrio dicarboxylicus]
MKYIVSRENPRFKALKKLCQSGRERRKARQIVLDGMHLVESLLASGRSPLEIVISDAGKARSEIARFLETGEKCSSVICLSDALFAELAPVETPSGILAIASMPDEAMRVDLAGDAVLLDGVQDPGNVGSILRSAAAAGFRQVLLSEDCAQVWSPKVLRAGMGAHFLLNLHESVRLPEFLNEYRGLSMATALGADSTGLYEQRLQGAVAWVFGSEGAGVCPDVMASVARRVRIPMPGGCESLNVAAAAAVCLFETVRQRNLAPVSC